MTDMKDEVSACHAEQLRESSGSLPRQGNPSVKNDEPIASHTGSPLLPPDRQKAEHLSIHNKGSSPSLSEHHRRRSTSYHEAGHVVVPYALGGRIRRVEIGKLEQRSGPSLGRVYYSGRAPGGDLDSATISVAGCIAQRLAGYPVGNGGRFDEIHTRAYLSPYAHLEPVIARRAEAIIKAYWDYLGTLAAVLQQRSRITATELKSVMNGWRFGPPDRVTIPDADDKTRLLLYILIYPEQHGSITPEWVRGMVEHLCPEFTASEVANLLRYIVDGLKFAYRDCFRCRTHDEVITDITLIENLAIAADRYHTRPSDEPVEMVAARIVDSGSAPPGRAEAPARIADPGQIGEGSEDLLPPTSEVESVTAISGRSGPPVNQRRPTR